MSALMNYDTGPLNWVRGDIETALQAAVGRLQAYSTDASLSNALRLASEDAHQVAGALKMVGLEGAATLARTLQDCLVASSAESSQPSPEMLRAMRNALEGLSRWVRNMADGRGSGELALFPLYKRLRELQGAERVFEGELFFPDVRTRVHGKSASEAPSGEALAATVKAARSVFQRGLLAFLRGSGGAEGLRRMRDALTEIEQVAPSQASRTFWWACVGFVDSLIANGVEADFHVKQLLARIDLQMRRLMEGSPQVAERLLRDALFFVAKSQTAEGRAAEVRNTFGLDRYLPGQELLDPEALARMRPVIEALKAGLKLARDIWHAQVEGSGGKIGEFQSQLERLQPQAQLLERSGLPLVLQQMGRAAAATQDHPGEQREALNLEVAATLLLLQNAVESEDILNADFAARAQRQCERLAALIEGRATPLADAGDHGERQAAERDMLLHLAHEVSHNLKQMEEILDSFFRDTEQRGSLAQLPALASQAQGALAMLDLGEAAALLGAATETIAAYADDGYPDAATQGRVADAFSSLGLFIESHCAGRADALEILRPVLVEFGLMSQAFAEDDNEDTVEAGLERRKLDVRSAYLTWRDDPSASEEDAKKKFIETLTELGRDAELIDDAALLHASRAALQASQAEARPGLELDTAIADLTGLSLPARPEPVILEFAARIEEAAFCPLPAADLPLAAEAAPTEVFSALVETARPLYHAAIEYAQPAWQAEVEYARPMAESLAQPVVTAADPTTPEAGVAEPAAEPVEAGVRTLIPEGTEPELLEIFLEEACEVLANLGQAAEYCRLDPDDRDSLTVIRRGFHTLKGSGRMVGLNELGEAAWALEQLMNGWLAENKPAAGELLNVIGMARSLFQDWVDALKTGTVIALPVSPLLGAAERVAQGLPVEGPVVAAAGVAAPPAAPEPAEVQAEAAPQQADELALELAAEFIEAAGVPQPGVEPAAAEPEAPGVAADESPAAESEVEFESEAVSAEVGRPDEAVPEAADFETHDFEFGEPLTVESEGVGSEPEPIDEVALEAADSAMPAFETHEVPAPEFELVGSDVEAFEGVAPESAEVEMQGSEAGESLPFEFEAFEPDAIESEAAELREAEAASHAFEADEPTLAEPAAAAPQAAEPEAFVLGSSAAEPAAAPVADDAPLPATAQQPDEVCIGGVVVSTGLYEIFVAEAQQHLATLRQELQRLLEAPAGTPSEGARRAIHTLAGIAGTSGFAPLADLAHALELYWNRFGHAPLPTSHQPLMQASVERLHAMVDAIVAAQAPEPASDLIAALGELEDERAQVQQPDTAAPNEEAQHSPPFAAAETDQAVVEVSAPIAEADTEVEAGDDGAAAEAAMTLPDLTGMVAETKPPANVPVFERREVADEIDEQLLPIFLEEAEMLVPDTSAQLRAWRAAPADLQARDGLRRNLHTLKGSARMAGAMRLGELTHVMESRVIAVIEGQLGADAEVFDRLEAEFDRLTDTVERLKSGEAGVLDKAPEAAQPLAAPVEPVLQPQLVVRPDDSPAEQAAVAQPLVRDSQSLTLRVRADWVDRMVNQAGEVAIARSRIESEIFAFKRHVTELSEALVRLRSHIREVEIQAESQMQATFQSHGAAEHFDPLEFDRFTRFQEVTRFLAESVNDISTVQHILLARLGETDAALLQQTRLNRELQQNLLRVRMVPLYSVSERLYRTVRQTARDVGKRAQLDIQGGELEIDRSVLEKVTAPIEHLLRNALAHGIEAPEVRHAAGKPEFGEIVLSAHQAGNEMVLTVKDDGRGLDFARIRQKAEALGLLTAGIEPSETLLAQMIFAAGFSTAESVSQVAGRGVGMDVVKSEISALGGRIDIASTAGVGTTFNIYLPLTLAMTQAVMVEAARQEYALPASLVQQVVELGPEALQKAMSASEFEWRGERYPLSYLPRLLGDAEAVHEVQRYNPLVLLRSGNSQAAVLVDAVSGTREVVVKNIGPQIARITGIAGATVRGDGRVVLILNPVPLALRWLSQPQFATQAPAAAPAVQASEAPLVLVVDDSLTVRKITTRLLTREGYRVDSAKDGVDALEKMRDLVPDVVLLDVEMPRMDGFELARVMRNEERLKRVPIIMITSRTADKHRNHAMEIGVNVYLGKPYQEQQLLDHIAEHVGHAAVTAG